MDDVDPCLDIGRVLTQGASDSIAQKGGRLDGDHPPRPSVQRCKERENAGACARVQHHATPDGGIPGDGVAVEGHSGFVVQHRLMDVEVVVRRKVLLGNDGRGPTATRGGRSTSRTRRCGSRCAVLLGVLHRRGPQLTK